MFLREYTSVYCNCTPKHHTWLDEKLSCGLLNKLCVNPYFPYACCVVFYLEFTCLKRMVVVVVVVYQGYYVRRAIGTRLGFQPYNTIGLCPLFPTFTRLSQNQHVNCNNTGTRRPLYPIDTL